MEIKSISFSSDKKLARCEMQFDYRYAQRLKPRLKKEGLFRGDWIHQLLQAHYRNPVWPSKRRLKTKGPTWTDKFDELYKTKWKKLFDEEKEMYGLDFPDYINELMTHYVDHWSGWDRTWKILHVEERFELMTKFGVPLRWQADLIVKDEDGSTVLVETKAKKSIPDSSERILQPQVHTYAWLLGKKGIKIDKILWNYIRTEPVPRPRILKSGDLSEAKCNTDKRGYLKSLQEAGIVAKTEEERLGLQNKLDSLPDTLSLERVTNSVNLKMGEMFVKDWIERHKRASAVNRALRSWTRDCKWDCDYYNLCQADMRGDVDRRLIINKDFVVSIKEAEELK